MQLNQDSILIRPASTWIQRSVVVALASALALFPAAAQLAITEVMSSPSSTPILRGADYWELTNFGTNALDLESFWFADNTGFAGALKLADLFEGQQIEQPQIGPGESIIFIRLEAGGIATPDEFRQWWGDSNLAPNLKIAVAPWDYGFGNTSDLVQLWEVTPSQTILVDRVVLFQSDPGDTFTCDPVTGQLNIFSKAGLNGAFRAATTTDIGSPGVTSGPIPLSVVQSPASTEVDGGLPVTLTVQAHGLPRPHYQWRFNGDVIPGEIAATFTVANAGTADAGEYTVEVSNGLTNIITAPATLRVNLTPSCARIVRPLADLICTPGQSPTFRVEVRGFPLPDIRWQFNGVDIPGATGKTYAVEGADESRAGLYTVFVSNALCPTNASARLDVEPPPKLIITEAMSSHSDNTAVPGHDDWWELTNADTYAVNLRGYRFDDKPGVIDGAVVVTNDVWIQPGQSVIWVSSMTPEAFRRWWGEENLPENLPIIPYEGNGFSTFPSDSIRLWNPHALTADDKIVSLSFANTNIGVSLWFDDAACEFGCLSVEGERGAFRAAESDDIGSPGWTSNEQRIVRPRITSIHHDSEGVTLTWKTQPGRSYEVRYSDRPAGAPWETLPATFIADGTSLTATAPVPANRSQRFYRVLLLPASP